METARKVIVVKSINITQPFRPIKRIYFCSNDTTNDIVDHNLSIPFASIPLQLITPWNITIFVRVKEFLDHYKN